MTNDAFQTIRNAIASIELFQSHYAGASTETQAHLSHVLAILRDRAKNFPHDVGGGSKLLLGFADALEQANAPGVYRSGIEK